MKLTKIMILILCFFMISVPVSAEELTVYYISPNGTIRNNGLSPESPTSFKRVKSKINSAETGDFLVYMMPGKYSVTETMKFNKVDCGDGKKKIEFKAYEKDKAIFSGGVSFNISDTASVSGDIREKFPEGAVNNIKQISLSSLGTEAGDISGYVALEVSASDKPLRLARYPNENEDMLEIAGANYSSVSENISIKVLDEKIYSWSNPSEIKAEIPLKYYWSWTKHSVSSLDAVNKIVNFSTKNNSFIASLNQKFYFYNIIEELDEEGEYYIDRTNNILYFYPYSDESEYVFSNFNSTMLNITSVKNLTFTDIVFENSKGDDAITLSGCDNVVFSGCTVRNILGSGITLDSSCKNIKINNCVIKNIGSTGLVITGGDVDSLTRGENIVDGCIIENCGITAKTGLFGVILSGCGNTVKNSKISVMPEDAIRYGGNDHTMDNNEISYACLYASDAGAIYSGRSWKTRGNKITNNFFHDIYGIFGGGAYCIYFDDGLGGETAEGNFFAYCANGVLAHGGRDIKLNKNKFFNCNNSMNVINISELSSFNADSYMNGVPLNDLWLNHYKELSVLKTEYESGEATIGYPKNNEATGNILFNTPDISFSNYALTYGGKLNNNSSLSSGLYR